MIILSKEQILLLHTQLLEETGGSDGIRDEGLLDSALNAPFQGFGNTNVFPSIQQKAAGESGFEELLRWITSHQL